MFLSGKIKNYKAMMMAATRNSSWRFIIFSKGLQNMHNDLPFFPERMKIEKCQKTSIKRIIRNIMPRI